jgi:membrane-associated phospholipid phosphatase
MFSQAFSEWSIINKILFNYLHSLSANNFCHQIFLFFSQIIGNYYLFPIHVLAAFLAIILYYNTNKEATNEEKRNSWESNFYLFAIICLSLSISFIIVEAIKIYSSFTRPYCDNTLKIIANNLHDISECNKSFPSGHSAYIACILLPIISQSKNNIINAGLYCFIIAVMISRVSLGIHYPADVAFSFMISFIVTNFSPFLLKKILSIKKLNSLYIWFKNFFFNLISFNMAHHEK